MYKAYVTTLKNVHKHPNADRLQLGECFGNTVCVSLDYTEGQIGVYFPTDGQLSVEFADVNNLVRKKDENGNNVGGYMDPDKRNVKAIKLRGEKSDGLFLPLHCLEPFGDITQLRVGDTIDVFNGHEICKKYIPRSNIRRGHYSEGNKTRQHKAPIAPLFMEHADTEQLAYNLGAFHCGDEIEITLKMHGTSQRTAYLPTLQGYKRTFWEKLTRKEGTPVYAWGGVSGTRRVVLEDFEGGFYGSNAFREQHSKFFEGKLWKGETVYYEVVGFTDTGTPIMAECSNKKLNDPDFVKQYGDTTVFSYGCDSTGYTELPMKDTGLPYSAVVPVPQSDIYVYRMTMTNEDGDVVEYTPDFMRYRCEQMGAKTVPVLWKGTIPYTMDDIESPIPGHRIVLEEGENAGEWIKDVAEQYYDGPDPIGKTHIREGVVVRIVNRPKFCAYKHKNFAFKCLEGIIKAEAEAPDMEEAEDIAKEEV
jgi:hypothetical protein